jgi:hypothetical protein
MDTCAAKRPQSSGRGQAAMRYLPMVMGEVEGFEVEVVMSL